jgi:AcrR family transcriptional regulator
LATVDETTSLLPPGVEVSAPKRRLYETAIELFGREGYHAVSIRDIANALGQQPSAIYFHVESKQELLFELALLGHQAHFETIRNALMDAGTDPHDQLRSVVRAHVTGHLTYPSMARLTNRELRALTEDQLRTVLTIRTATEQIFIDVLDRGVRMEAFNVADTWLCAKAIGAMGVRVPEWFTPDTPRTPEQIVDNYVTYAMKLVA